MITTAGKGVVKKVFSGQAAQLAHSMSLGVGTAAETLTDTRLAAEVVRVPVSSIYSDTTADRVVFKATVPPGLLGTIYEAGLVFEDNSQEASRTLNLIDPSTLWTNATVVTGNGRANARTVKIDYVANGTTNAELAGLYENLSTFTGTGTMLITFTVTANLSSLRVRVGTDSANYYELLVSSPTVGYNISRVNVSAATKIGSPDWANLNYLAIRPSATAAGAGTVYIDNLRFETAPGTNILVARKVLATPYVVDTSIQSEIEYALGVTA